MNISIVGTGVIGTLYGWALSNVHTITHYVRKNKENLLQNKTISCDVIDERLPEGSQNITSTYTYYVTSQLNTQTDLVIVPVTSLQVTEVITTLKNQLPNGRFLIMSLNWNGTSEIDRLLSKDQYILGYAGGGGTFKDDLLWANLGQDLLLGSVYPEQQELLQETVSLFKSSGFLPEVPPNILHSLWMHNVGSAPLGAGLSKYHDMLKLIADPDLVKICFDAMTECYKICEARGVALNRFPEVQMYTMPFDQLYPMFKHNFETNPVMQRYTAHAVKAIPEMLANFKEMYYAGHTLSIAIPNMERLYDLISN